MKNNGYKVEEIQKGFYYCDNVPEKAYLINIETLNKADKELLLALLSKSSRKRTKAYEHLKKQKYYRKFAQYIYYLIYGGILMRLVEEDKEWARIASLTFEEWMQEVDPKIRLKGIKPEDILSVFEPEEIVNLLKQDTIASRLEPEEIVNLLKQDAIVSRLKPEEILKLLKPEDIEAYLRKQKRIIK